MTDKKCGHMAISLEYGMFPNRPDNRDASQSFWHLPCFQLLIPKASVKEKYKRFHDKTYLRFPSKSNRKAMNRNWSNQKANPALKTKAGNK